MASFAAILAMGNPVALDANAEDLDTRGVHLDGDQAAISGVDGELDVAATGVHTHFTQNGEALVSHDLELAVGQRHGGCHGHGVTGVHTQRIHVFDGAHHHAVVVGIAHEFQLVFFPAENGLFNEHIGFG